MQLLVSVTTAAEAAAALAGGAHIVDAKDPARGALGAVRLDMFAAIRQTISGTRPLSAAIGDGTDERIVEHDAFLFAAAGAAFVKLGFAGSADPVRAASLLAAAVRGANHGGARRCGVVAVAYADAAAAGSLPSQEVIDVAVHAGAAGVLLDTADKSRPGLRAMLPAGSIERWVERARGLGLRTALAGKLEAGDIPFARATGANNAGVRGAACDGGRLGPIASARVRILAQLVGDDSDAGDRRGQRLPEVRVDQIAR